MKLMIRPRECEENVTSRRSGLASDDAFVTQRFLDL
jgi:hypothetical protein